MEEALTVPDEVSWLPHPWYHDEAQLGSNSMSLSHHSICVYCNDITHSPAQCPDRLSCIIPSYHTNFGDDCPADPHCHILDTMLDAISEANRDLEEGVASY
jgi:hypothetical protein